MNLGEMRALLRINLNDLRGGRYNNETCRILLNSAYEDVWRELIAKGRYFARTILNVTFTGQEMPLNDNIQRIILVQDSDGNPIPIWDEFKSKKSQVPSVYEVNVKKSAIELVSKKLGWYIIPNSSFILTVIYVPLVSQFIETAQDTDIIDDIPIQYHKPIVSWATILALGGDEQNINYWTAIYDKQMADLNEMKLPEEVVDYYANY